ncbi:hypothetical protein [Burkholderia gladioli]|uniref:hypothetical protein n=1 Tax=Burkholderia gladioli TaxID=28095 RepID=UPI00163FA0D2|nr:hypothetical protein [Burkholderia gladioli]
MNKPPLHAEGPASTSEFTLCGIAFDAQDSGDIDEPIVFAKAGQVVDCEDCRRIIDYVKSFKRYRQPGDTR